MRRPLGDAHGVRVSLGGGQTSSQIQLFNCKRTQTCPARSVVGSSVICTLEENTHIPAVLGQQSVLLTSAPWRRTSPMHRLSGNPGLLWWLALSQSVIIKNASLQIPIGNSVCAVTTADVAIFVQLLHCFIMLVHHCKIKRKPTHTKSKQNNKTHMQ